MKVLLVNGSGHKNGTTYTALHEVELALNSEGMETEIVWLGTEPIAGCIGCEYCGKSGECFRKDIVNAFIEKAKHADGFVFGSPVHYAAASGAMTSFLDRVFYSAPAGTFRHKPAAVVVAARRGGCTAAYEQLVKYPAISEMPIISTNYWNMVHGLVAADAAEDKEGMQGMKILGKNMAYFLKCIDAGRTLGIKAPAPEKRDVTNFVR